MASSEVLIESQKVIETVRCSDGAKIVNVTEDSVTDEEKTLSETDFFKQLTLQEDEPLKVVA